ncbi:MAG: DNA replication/repair protein RecF [Kangiellaceae bacterium]|nr:DNA replication/repair protein RecF [Kangiellaceae bacterium]
MTQLARLSIEHCRILSQVTIDPSPRMNLLVGGNGSGKSAVLEGIHLLSYGRSFRSRSYKPLIQHQADWIRVVAKVKTVESEVSLGIERERSGKLTMRYNGDDVARLSEFATHLPTIAITPDSIGLLHEGPKVRRAFMDWGVFYSQQALNDVWQRLNRLLKQRNSALKNKAPYRELASWDQEYAQLAGQLSYLRSQYIQKLLEYAQPLLTQFLGQVVALDVLYYPGWRDDVGLLEQLEQHYARDLLLGYTTVGPHKADIKFRCEQGVVQEVLSRGQQKLLVYALKLAQGAYISEDKGRRAIYLVDDLPSELDQQSMRHVWQALIASESQVWLTSSSGILLDFPAEVATRQFSVTQGQVTLVTE